MMAATVILGASAGLMPRPAGSTPGAATIFNVRTGERRAVPLRVRVGGQTEWLLSYGGALAWVPAADYLADGWQLED